MTQRRNDIDWLRIGATWLLFVFHTGKIFDPAPFFHVRNADLSLAFLVLCGFISLWHMPLFFVLAGWSIGPSLDARGLGGFLRERVTRLLVPLLAGAALFGPIMKYLELRGGLDLFYGGLRVSPAWQDSFREVIPTGLQVAPPFDESFFAFLPTFFTHLTRFSWGHLWFIAYLFTFTVAYAPLLAWLRQRAGRMRRMSPAWIYAPVLPLALIQLWLRPRWPGIQNLFDDWANVAYYTVYLFGGFALGCEPALERLVATEWRRALGLAAATALVLLLVVLGVVTSPWVALAGSAVAGWCFVVAIVGLGHRLAAYEHPWLPYLRESAFPIYLLHQVAIVVIGYAVVPLSLGIGVKFLTIFAGSILASLATYHFVVRPSLVVGTLFGTAQHRYSLRAAAAAGALLLAVVAGATTAAGAAASPLGLWYAEGGAAQVEIEECGGSLCGRVVWLRSPWDESGCVLRDRYNPDPDLRARPVIGLEILHGLSPGADGVWRGGAIYDPASGQTYRCQLGLDGEDHLWLRGYVGVPLFGRSTRWFRVGAEERVCRATEGR